MKVNLNDEDLNSFLYTSFNYLLSSSVFVRLLRFSHNLPLVSVCNNVPIVSGVAPDLQPGNQNERPGPGPAWCVRSQSSAGLRRSGTWSGERHER